jgi:proton-coupled amino acid transporter
LYTNLSIDCLPLMSTGVNKANYESVPRSKSNPLSLDNDDPVVETGAGHNETTVLETFLHLLKGFLGAGCLSLPWAVSELGIVWGVVAILIIACWTSYNCWSLVKLKRYVEGHSSDVDDRMTEASTNTSITAITAPDLGEWAFGKTFKSYVRVCICTLQLCICTVFFSFVGENLLAVFRYFGSNVSHVGVMTIFLPVILALSFIPSLKTLAPVMASGLYLLLFAFFGIGVIIGSEWQGRPDHTPELNPPQVPLAVCAILYSMEGINLVLPLESAMKEPHHFKRVFVMSMAVNALILASLASICVLTFGEVTNGSVTAFLLEAYQEDESIIFWLMMANTAVSLSVLVTYPLQMYPALELLAPWWNSWWFRIKSEDNEDLSGFEQTPEDSTDSETPMEQEHEYGNEVEELEEDEIAGSSISYRGSMINTMRSRIPKLTIPGDSFQLRATLVFTTYLIAVVVPNVQVLISLVGAMAGSSTALLIPSLLELGWIRHMEMEADRVYRDENEDTPPPTNLFGIWWFEKLKCYVLLGLGLVIFFIGSTAALSDIVRIYTAKG